jgi:hypothetical protein
MTQPSEKAMGIANNATLLCGMYASGPEWTADCRGLCKDIALAIDAAIAEAVEAQRDAWIKPHSDGPGWDAVGAISDQLHAEFDRQLQSAIVAEREACAEIAESAHRQDDSDCCFEDPNGHDGAWTTAKSISEAIRARGEGQAT